jgi:hypothetical protein
MNVLGCKVTGADIAQWTRYFVCDPAPYAIPSNTILPATVKVMSRAAFVESDFELSYRDSYATYAMTLQAQTIAFLTADDFDQLEAETQQRLLAAQMESKRGHIYLWDEVAEYVQSCLALARTRCFSRHGRVYLVPDMRLWQAIPDDVRIRWIIDWISLDAPHCRSSTLSEHDWLRLNQPNVRKLAGTFASKSGPNCFATTVAAISRSDGDVTQIADQWLHQPEFLAALYQHGYQVNLSASVSDLALYDAVLVWFDHDHRAQHTCYLVGEGLAINKNSQAWFSPRQLLLIKEIVAYWSDTNFQIQVYERKR